jgi:dolichyl-phosphate beta-glucosyltransferase
MAESTTGNENSLAPGSSVPAAARERPALSVVIPAYNEAARLPGTLKRIGDYVIRTGMSCEIIVVDDGSTDETWGMLERFESGPLYLLLCRNPRNRGKGHAVRQGVACASGAAVLMCDADLSTPIEQIDRLLPWLDGGYDVVIGSRDMPESVLDPPQPLMRRCMAWIFRAIRRRLLLPEIRDTQCGFKLFRGSAAAQIFPLQTLDGWLFDCEVLALAERLGQRIKEVGVRWENHPHTRVRPLVEAFRAIPTLLAVRRRVRGMKGAGDEGRTGS